MGNEEHETSRYPGESNHGESNKVKAKEISKWSMVIGSTWIAVFTIIKAFWGLFAPEGSSFGLEMGDILLSGLVLAAMFTPVYVSIILDKIRDIKIGR